MSIKDALTKKIGPLPAWVYAGGGAVVVAFLMLRGSTKGGDSLIPLPTGNAGDSTTTTTSGDSMKFGSMPPYDPIYAPYTPDYQGATEYFTPAPATPGPTAPTGGTETGPVATTPVVGPFLTLVRALSGGAIFSRPGTEEKFSAPFVDPSVSEIMSGKQIKESFGSDIALPDDAKVILVGGVPISLSEEGVARQATTEGISGRDVPLAEQHPEFHTYYGPDNANALKIPTGSEIETSHENVNGRFVATTPKYQNEGLSTSKPNAATLEFLSKYGYAA